MADVLRVLVNAVALPDNLLGEVVLIQSVFVHRHEQMREKHDCDMFDETHMASMLPLSCV